MYQDIGLLFDLSGFILSMSSLAIVVNSSSILVSGVRQGFFALASGLTLIAASFVWSIFFNRLGFLGMPDMQPLFLSSGMALLLFAAHRLFTFPTQKKK
jgi:hypothetical protein